jgi:hypothetical protein
LHLARAGFARSPNYTEDFGMFRSWMLVIGLCAVVGLSGDRLGFAAPQKGKAKAADLEELFKKLDADNDGKLSKDEFKKIGDAAGQKVQIKNSPFGGAIRDAIIEKLFEKLDADSDGMLTMDEFKKLPDVVNGVKDKVKSKIEGSIDPETIKKFKEKVGGDK